MSKKILKPCFGDCSKRIEKLEKQNKALTKLCILLLDFVDKYDEAFDEQTEDTDSMIKMDGKSFVCECGCNVFRKLKKEPHIFRCNACLALYESEK